MKTFGKLDRDGRSTRLPTALTTSPSTPGGNEHSAERPAVVGFATRTGRRETRDVASLRERVMEQIEPSVAATVSPRFRRQIEKSSIQSPARSGSNCPVASSFNWRTSLRMT